MSELFDNFIYCSDGNSNWFYKKYYYNGANLRYYTFQIALNLLSQKKKTDPVILETGCQRLANDLGAGMSSSIFGEFLHKYGGHLITVDNFHPHLVTCQECTLEWCDCIDYVLSDSLSFLKDFQGRVDLLYLDSLDYPVGEDKDNIQMRDAAQLHCLNEFKAIEPRLPKDVIVMADDNQLPSGGKPKFLKEYLQKKGWICLLDFQQTIWVRKV